MTPRAVSRHGHEQDRKTPDEWCRIKGVRVLDPDGWRIDGAPAWDEPISEAEFDDRAAISTAGPWRWEPEP